MKIDEMTKRETIEELKSLIAGFEEVHGACPICLYKAVEYLEKGGDGNGKV